MRKPKTAPLAKALRIAMEELTVTAACPVTNWRAIATFTPGEEPTSDIVVQIGCNSRTVAGWKRVGKRVIYLNTLDFLFRTDWASEEEAIYRGLFPRKSTTGEEAATRRREIAHVNLMAFISRVDTINRLGKV